MSMPSAFSNVGSLPQRGGGGKSTNPGYNTQGQNVFGMNSPIQAMTGGDANKARGIADYYHGIEQQYGPQSLEGMQAQAVTNPGAVDQNQLTNLLRQKMLQNSSFLQQIPPNLLRQ